MLQNVDGIYLLSFFFLQEGNSSCHPKDQGKENLLVFVLLLEQWTRYIILLQEFWTWYLLGSNFRNFAVNQLKVLINDGFVGLVHLWQREEGHKSYNMQNLHT